MTRLKENLKLRVIASPKPIVNFTGKWKNELKSQMELSVNAKGIVKGTYRTAVGKPSNYEKFDLTGYATGDLIGFTVNFGKYGSLTAWTGQHTKKGGKEVIKTLWHMAVNVEDEDEKKKLWGAVWSGSNDFKRI